MELHQIRYFLALCEELHFTRAAERCAVAQSSLTRAIKALETELGGELFHRERTNTHLTRLGERVKPSLDQAWRHVQEARRLAREAIGARGSSLRLGLMRTLAPTHPVALIAALRADHPGIALHASQEDRETLHELVLSGEIDAAIGDISGPDDRLDRLALCREPIVLVVNASHRLAQHATVDLHDLAGEPCFARSGCVVEEAAPGVATTFRSERDDWLLAMAAAGLGHALMPESSAIWPGTVALALAQPIMHEVALVTARERPRHAALEALLQTAARLRSIGSAAPACVAQPAMHAPAAR